LYAQAADDWEQYLRLDPEGPWSREARLRLKALRVKIKEHDESRSQPLFAPEEFNKRVEAQDPKTWAQVEPRIEEYLATATTDWLPTAFMSRRSTSSPQAR